MPVERQPGDPQWEAYPNAAAAVGAELARVALRIRVALQEQSRGARPAAGTSTNDGEATTIERELTRLETPPGRAPRTEDAELARLQERLAQRTRRNAGNREVTQPPVPLYTLAERAALTPLAFDLFMLALALEMDEGFARALAGLFGVTAAAARGRRLDLATAARVLTPDDVGAGALRLLLMPGAALADLGLLEMEGGRGVALTTTLQVPAPVVAYVLGQPIHDAGLRLFVRVLEAKAAPPRSAAFLPAESFAHAAALLDDGEALLCLEGPAGVGKVLLMHILGAERGRDVLEVDVRSAPEGLGPRETQAIARLGFLRDAVVVLRLPGPGKDEGKRPAWHAGVLDVLARYRSVVLARDASLTASGISDAGALEVTTPPPRRLSPLMLPPPDLATREALWRERLARAGGRVDAAVDYALLARSYPITAGVITRIAAEAQALARARGGDGSVSQGDVLRAVEAEFRPRLQTVGRRLVARSTLSELVLAAETRDTLEEMEATVRLRHRVLEEWGLRRIVHGRGVSALFYGEPGTGKTLAAGVIAASCGLPLYQIDTAQVVSKWVGETEKNLAEVFRAAEAGHAMLLFDEADAIFGKRTDVQHSTDRFANMQTNFLLTQIESHNGVVVLTTNKESVMDPAFQRRLTFRVHFPMPEDKEREELWRRMLAGQEAHSERIHYGELARRLQMSGGYIRNAVLRAAYLAAARGAPLTTSLLREAAELVLRDAGKVI